MATVTSLQAEKCCYLVSEHEASMQQGTPVPDLQGAANKSNPLPCFVNISTTNRNF